MKHFKTLLLLICILLAQLSLAQSDPLHLVKGNRNLYDLQWSSVTNWNHVWSKCLDNQKARFFYIDDHVSFIDYLSGAYDDPKDKVLVEEAIKAVKEVSAFTFAYCNLKVEEAPPSKEEVKLLINKAQDFYVVRYCPTNMRDELYSNYLKLVHLYIQL